MEIPIAMILACRLLRFRANRMANIIAGGVLTLVNGFLTFVPPLAGLCVFDACGRLGSRLDRMRSANTFLVKFKRQELGIRPVTAGSAEIQDEHLAFLASDGKLAALFLLEMVESWSEISHSSI